MEFTFLQKLVMQIRIKTGHHITTCIIEIGPHVVLLVNRITIRALCAVNYVLQCGRDRGKLDKLAFEGI